MKTLSLGLALFVSMYASSALADEASTAPANGSSNGVLVTPPAQREATTQTTWTGWQSLAADGASLVTIAGGLGIASTSDGAMGFGIPVVLLGGASYVGAAPTLHFLQRDYGKGAVSLAMRVSLPVLGGVLGSAARCEGPRNSLLGANDPAKCPVFDGLAKAGIGFLVGMGVASIVDATALGFHSESATPERPRQANTVRMTPNVGASPKGASVGVSGTF